MTIGVFKSIAAGIAACNAIAQSVGASLELVDVGINAPGKLAISQGAPGVTVTDGRVRRGTRDCVAEAAMAADEVGAALAVGQDAAERAAAAGQQVICVGEIGIGNTTSAAALLSALTGACSFMIRTQMTCRDLAESSHLSSLVATWQPLARTACYNEDTAADPARTDCLPSEQTVWRQNRLCIVRTDCFLSSEQRGCRPRCRRVRRGSHRPRHRRR